MSDEIVVEREENGDSGRYVVYLPGGAEAEMTYRRTQPGTIAIDHTGVPPEFRNQGIAIKLVEAGIADAQQEGTRIVPLCSYVAAQFRRHPDWAPLLA
ncbi:MAG: N-acetyltransferase [Hyphomicrobiales bacterium]|nr:MAG: N-acetyltransferase [Hyphomicrobiales bacterium]